MTFDFYNYQATITRVVDGDTFDADIDLGFKILYKVRFRMAGINAPEMKTEAGPKAKDFLAAMVEGHPVVLRTKKPDKYGRWVAEVFLGDVDVNHKMIAEGYAVEYMTSDVPA